MSAKLTLVEVIVRNTRNDKEVIVCEHINESEFDNFIDMAELLIKLKDAVQEVKS